MKRTPTAMLCFRPWRVTPPLQKRDKHEFNIYCRHQWSPPLKKRLLFDSDWPKAWTEGHRLLPWRHIEAGWAGCLLECGVWRATQGKKKKKKYHEYFGSSVRYECAWLHPGLAFCMGSIRLRSYTMNPSTPALISSSFNLRSEKMEQ